MHNALCTTHNFYYVQIMCDYVQLCANYVHYVNANVHGVTPLRARVGVRGVGGRHSFVPRILAASRLSLRRSEGSPLERRRRSEQDGKSERGGATGQLAGARPPFAGFPAAKRQQMSSELRTTSQVHHGRERYAHEMLCMPSMLPCGAKNHRF